MYQSFFDELIKLAAEETEGTKEKLMRKAVAARPWIKRFVGSAIPTAVAANFLVPLGGSKTEGLKRGLVAGAGLLGGSAGVADLAMKRWAEKNPRSSLSQQIQKEGAANLFLKVAAMATDLRMKGIGGVKRPPMPTEDSKQKAFQNFENSTQPGKFLNSTQPKHLRAPGPSIKQVSALPTG